MAVLVQVSIHSEVDSLVSTLNKEHILCSWQQERGNQAIRSLHRLSSVDFAVSFPLGAHTVQRILHWTLAQLTLHQTVLHWSLTQLTFAALVIDTVYFEYPLVVDAVHTLHWAITQRWQRQ